ncbi:MAG: peptide deformylase [Acidimicrobiia bacterium]|nr:peptide deformylase [Acidimicrobiia bacterium]MBT8194422.1 peptide deformylase [Acidimicrobiia bacterium]MBT8247414.1 peptide deformylase [Acidimicrobiia bacterium]NNF88795.1 peptide deformylase [Acidimicrobiia bacterium]NNJ48689.1 peptide deformylase [Acidimicrobiia bacterium]
MAVFPIRTFGDPVLNTVAQPVETFDAALERLIEDMLETMYAAPGVGLAGPQIGIARRVFVYDIGEGPGHMVNPELVETSGEWEFDEGCLSVPERFWPIVRPSYARIEGVAMDGSPLELEGDELMGRMLQHEFDHLDGTLLLERLGKRERKTALRDLRREALGIALPE